MNTKWRAERNRVSLSIKNELQIYLNYEKSCREFHNYVITVPKLLSAAASGEKYYYVLTEPKLLSAAASGEKYYYVLTEPKLLSAAASGEKYYWRRKSTTCTAASASSASGTAVTPTNKRQ